MAKEKIERVDYQDTTTVDKTVKVTDATDNGVKVTKVEGAPELETAEEDKEDK